MTANAPRAMDAEPLLGVSHAGLSPAEEIFEVRPFRSSDMAFVMDSWLRVGWWQESQRLRTLGYNRFKRSAARDPWFRQNRSQAEKMLVTDGVTVLVAVDREDDNHIAGWIAVYAGRRVAGAVKGAYQMDHNGEPWGVEDMLSRAAGLAERSER